jgi:hypothetical protein
MWLGARLGLLAVLFQAILFGWHHHELPPRGRLPAMVVETPAGPQQLAADDGCEICQVLHHLTAAPADPPPILPLLATRSAFRPDGAGFVVRPLAPTFHARAPPLA